MRVDDGWIRKAGVRPTKDDMTVKNSEPLLGFLILYNIDSTNMGGWFGSVLSTVILSAVTV